jgi:serine/threonine protein kinase
MNHYSPTIDETTSAPFPKREKPHAPRAIVLDPPGDLIGDRYEVIREIGRGGMGIVYQAMDKKLNRFVAVKRLIPTASNGMRDQRRFFREAQTIASLGHMYIVNIFDIGQDGLGHYITMEYVTGPKLVEEQDGENAVTLGDYVKEKGPLGEELAAELIRKLCSALEYAHLQEIVHRDIKPNNVLLTPTMDPKLVDFGLARTLGVSEDITLEGQFVGTPEYVAPEQWTSNEVDERVDIYALGAVMWYAISGKLPRYYSESDVSEAYRPIFRKAMAHKPNDRFQTIREFGAALEPGDETQRMDLSEGSPPDSMAGVSEGSITSAGIAWICPTCDKQCPDAAKYCVHCGTCGMASCPLCEAEVRVGIQYCHACGADMEAAEKHIGALQEAKNQASFYEFEAALANIKSLAGNNSIGEIAALVKGWRQNILKRRNMLNEFDAAMRCYNVPRAIETNNELKLLVPTECLSESPDFEISVKYSTLLQELKRLLQEAASRARADFNLAQYGANVCYLKAVFGDEACMTITDQLYSIEQDLNHTVTQAGLAIGMNCVSYALELLENVDPWHNGELGDRRERSLRNCKELIENRAQAIDTIEAAIRDAEYTCALEAIKDMAQFRLPPRNSEMIPARGDSAAHERIVIIDKTLTSTISEILPDWVRQDDWEAITLALEALKAGNHSTWKRCEEQAKNLVHKEVARRYNHAVEIERKGRLAQADRAWQIFQRIPRDLVTPNLWQYSLDFIRRRQIALRSRRNRVIKRVILGAFSLWAAPLVLFAIRPAYFAALTEQPLSIVPGAINLILFIAGTVLIRRKKLLRHELTVEIEQAPARINILCGILVLSPLSVTVYVIASKVLSFYAADSPVSTISLALVGVCWLCVDIIRRNLPKVPGGLSLTASWAVAACAMAMTQSREIEPAALWPGVAIVHWLAYFIFQVIHHIVHPPARESQRAHPNKPTSSPTDIDPADAEPSS